MPVWLSSTGLVLDGQQPVQHLLRFLDTVMRGIGQVMLQNNNYTCSPPSPRRWNRWVCLR
jgi:urea transporter